MELETVYSSNIPIDCHILKGRLEKEGIECQIYDENIVWVHPFKAVAIGGVKLKVPSGQSSQAKEILGLLKQEKLHDHMGEYEIHKVLEEEVSKENKIIELKAFFRENPKFLDNPGPHKPKWINQHTYQNLVEHERVFQKQKNTTLNFNVKQFLYELFDFDRSVFSYLRTKPVEYYLEKELVEQYQFQKQNELSLSCPKCNSVNVAYGHAIDHKLDIIYLLLSILISPAPLVRKKYHCFNCRASFK